MKFIFIFVLLCSSVVFADEAIFSRIPSPQFARLPEAPYTRCDVYQNRVVITYTESGLSVSTSKDLQLNGDFDSGIKEVLKSKLVPRGDIMGPPFYQYSVRGTVIKVMGKCPAMINSPAADLLVTVIDQACK